MGSFLVRQDVATELNVKFSESTQPSIAEIEHMIEDIEAEVRGFVTSAGLAVPTKTANPYSFSFVRMTTMWGVCSRCQAAYGGNVINMSPREEMYWDRYQAYLKKIQDTPSILSDATTLSTQSNMPDGITDSDDEYHESIHAMDDVY